MKGTFEVDSAAVRKHLTRFMMCAIFGASAVSLGARYFSEGMDFQKSFPHLTTPYLIGIVIGIPALSYLTSALIGWAIQRASITIDEYKLHGADYWMRRRCIPLNELIELRPFSNNGINAMIAVTRASGNIYISPKTERYEEIIEFLSTFLPPEVK